MRVSKHSFNQFVMNLSNSESLCASVFPKIAAITVPKMPIITPKGDEIILRKKYNNNMNLLREAFESQMQLVDEQEVEKKPAVVKSERKTSEDHTPSQTPFSRHRTERSITFTE